MFDDELLWCDDTAAAATFAPPVPISVDTVIADARTATMPAVARSCTQAQYPATVPSNPVLCFYLGPRAGRSCVSKSRTEGSVRGSCSAASPIPGVRGYSP